MSYYNRERGKHYADVTYTLPNGDTARHHKSYPSKQEADGVEAYIRATGTLPPHLNGGIAGRSFAAIAEEFKERNREWLNAHGKTNVQRLEFAIEHLGKLDIRHVRTRELEGFRDKVLARAGTGGNPPSNRTVNRYLDAVGKVLEFALERDEIPARPKMPRMKDEGEDRDALRWDQEDAIVYDMERRGKHVEAFLVRLLAGTGLRAGELQLLDPGQIETPEQDENCGILLSEKQTKTKAARWVPLLRPAATKLRAMIAQGTLPKAFHLYRAFKTSSKVCGDGTDFCIHSLRHTTITRLLASGAHPTDVAKITGHIVPGMPKMQLRYYHPDKPHLFKVAEKVQSRCGENTKTSSIVALNQSRSA